MIWNFFEEEHPARKKIRKLHKQGLKVIASHHDFYETPDREVMKMLLEQMCAGGADIVKLAVMPQNMEDVLKLLSVTYEFKEENPDTPVITMSMGKMGMISRLCGESFGARSLLRHTKKRVHQVRWRCMRWLIFWRKCIKLLNKYKQKRK